MDECKINVPDRLSEGNEFSFNFTFNDDYDVRTKEKAEGMIKICRMIDLDDENTGKSVDAVYIETRLVSFDPNYENFGSVEVGWDPKITDEQQAKEITRETIIEDLSHLFRMFRFEDEDPEYFLSEEEEEHHKIVHGQYSWE